jgi:hypothetical protein
MSQSEFYVNQPRYIHISYVNQLKGRPSVKGKSSENHRYVDLLVIVASLSYLAFRCTVIKLHIKNFPIKGTTQQEELFNIEYLFMGSCENLQYLSLKRVKLKIKTTFESSTYRIQYYSD